MNRILKWLRSMMATATLIFITITVWQGLYYTALLVMLAVYISDLRKRIKLYEHKHEQSKDITG